MGTSNNKERHSELVSESPKHKEIADPVRNDGRGKKEVIRFIVNIIRIDIINKDEAVDIFCA